MPGDIVTEADIHVLRPAPHGSLPPKYRKDLIGMTLTTGVDKGKHFKWDQF